MLLVNINDNTNKTIFVKNSTKNPNVKEEVAHEGNSVYSISKFKLQKPEDLEILTTHEDGLIHSWRLEEDNLIENSVYSYFNLPVTSVNSSLDDKKMIAGCKDHSAIVWETGVMNKMNYFLVGHSDYVSCADFITNDLVATSSWDTTLRLWKLD
jgi:WD40 repeat protein